MKENNYEIVLTVNTTASEAFNTINNIAKWWTGDLEGSSQNLNDAFTVHFGDIHVSTQKLIELVPDKKVVWLVTDSRLNFIEDKQEWTNTKITFEITSQNNQTEIRFTHFGLVPEIECYDACVQGWDYYIKGSLFRLLTEGKGTPGLMA